MVPHHDQTNAPDGGLRFIMSLRITGEGHISSIEFRAGTMEHDG
ncbi:MAG TPA: glycosidase, partial [Verrucomicrobiales bacterium]|nr:glycosidase [Verrucomicrobiales bacterium]